MTSSDVVDGMIDLWTRLTDTSNLLSCAQCSHERRRSPMRKSHCFPAAESHHDVPQVYETIPRLTPRAFDPRPPSPPRPRSASPQRSRQASNPHRVNAYEAVRTTAGEQMLRCATTFPSFVPSESFMSPDRRSRKKHSDVNEGVAMTPYGPAPPPCVRESVSPCRSAAGVARRNSYQEAVALTPYGPAPTSQQRDMVSPDARTASPCPSELQLAQQSAPTYRRTMDKADLRSLLDRHVDYYLHQHPEVRNRRNVCRKAPGIYEVGGRTVTVEWQHDVTNRGPGRLMARDGPLLQPFGDYMEQKDTDASYSCTGLKWSNLEKLPRETRMTFEDTGDSYSRLDAMKVAKEQANFREQAAQYAHSGHSVPMDLWQKYEKTMDVKLGHRWGSNARSRVAERFRPITEPAPQRSTLDAKHTLIPEVLQDPTKNRHGRAHSLEPSSLLGAQSGGVEPPSIFGAQPDLFKMVGLMRPEVRGGA